jgi:hypothetical protein
MKNGEGGAVTGLEGRQGRLHGDGWSERGAMDGVREERGRMGRVVGAMSARTTMTRVAHETVSTNPRGRSRWEAVTIGSEYDE